MVLLYRLLDEADGPRVFFLRLAFSLLVHTKQSIPTRLFLKKSRTTLHSPVQRRSENALPMGPNPILGHLSARILLLAITVDLHIAGNCLDAPL
jgi:hypothetical protein